MAAELTSLLSLTPEGVQAETTRVPHRPSAHLRNARSFELGPLQQQAALFVVWSVGFRPQRLPSEVA